MKTHRIGIIGAGMYGKILAGCFQKDPRARVTWINSASEATTKAAAHEFGVEKWTLDYREVLADPAVDAVAIATPPYLHARQFSDALAAGKHVLLEKPMAESPQSVEKIVQAAEQSPRLITLDASARHTRLTRKFGLIKSIIDRGGLGEIYHIHHNHLQRGTFIEWNPKGAWAMNQKLAGGGPFIDWGVYDLSFHLGLLGDKPELKTVRSFARRGLRDVSRLVAFSDIEQHGAAWLEFSGGLTYYYERGSGVHAEAPNETRLYGTKGGLRFQFPAWDSNTVERFYDVEGEPRKEELTVEAGGALDDSQAVAVHFLDCLDGKSKPLMPIPLAAKHMRILFAILGQ
ncbi:MAG: Gfo/Idh/MocA family oxidoreductase [Anaerolineales bacterium]|nr:Gfo/Idh/MocA family oxidoreductase [Anaerolineales bacterium]